MQRRAMLELLRRAPALRHLPAEGLDALHETADLRVFSEGETLAVEGASSPELFLVLEGRVGIGKQVVDRSERIAGRGPGEWVGEGAVFSDELRSATVTAETPVMVLAFDHKSFVEALAGNADAVIDLVKMVRARLYESDAQLIDTLQQRLQTLSSVNVELSQQNRTLRDELDQRHGFERFVGASAAAAAVRQAATQAAQSQVPILLLGETGTGKEILARAIHHSSDRARARFVAVNCGLLSEALLESELFGHARGAFTGAQQGKRGLVEVADGGTLFLDEVGDMPGGVQAGLLRFLEQGEYRRLGETELRRSDVRVIAATNHSLEDAAGVGGFRRDLLYRLDVVRLSIPPLRERGEDLPLLAAHYIELIARRLSVEPLRLSPSALDALACHDFPGNVRELENEIERLYAMLQPGARITPEDLSPRFSTVISSEGDYHASLRSFKAHMIGRALRDSRGSRTIAARRLGIHRSNLTRMIRELDLLVPG